MVRDEGLDLMVLHGEFYCVEGSAIDVHELSAVIMAINDIWHQAHITFSMAVRNDPVPYWPSGMTGDDLRPALDSVSLGPSLRPFVIRGFCGPWSHGINGYSHPHLEWAIPLFTFFIRDHRIVQSNGSESPPLARVAAHELGHILGLSHYPQPPTNLMVQGAMGTALTPDEIVRARNQVDVILNSAGILLRGTPVEIIGGPHIGSSGNIEIHVWNDADGIPLGERFGYLVTMADGRVATVGANLIAKLAA